MRRHLLSVCLVLFSLCSYSQGDRPVFSMAVDSPLVGHKVQVESVGVLGIPYRLATRNMKIYHSAQLTLFPTNYDTLDHYIKNVVDFHGYKLDVVYFDFTGKKYLINSKD